MLIQIDRDAVDADDAGRFCNVHAAFLAVAAGPALADCGGNHEASEDTKKEKSSGV
jgi:ribonuclease PH